MPGGHGEKHTRHREKAMVALLSHSTVAEAASHAQINERTLRRWMKQEAFNADYRTARQKLVRHALGEIQAASSTAVATLQAVMPDADAPAHARVSAARTVLELGLKATMLEDFDQRMAALEAALTPRRLR